MTEAVGSSVRYPRHRRIAKLLIENWDDTPGFWPWLGELDGRPVDQKWANKFLLASILDYQIKAETAWENGRWLAEDEFGDPDDLWHQVTKVPLATWNARFARYRLHRFPKAHERVWTIGKRIVDRYEGDARRIWEGQAPADALCRLEALGVGEQISRMVVGALRDTKQIAGTGDVKADLHVSRVTGRLLFGSPLTPAQAIIETRRMHPEDPWKLDRPLYQVGKTLCVATNPLCPDCYLIKVCAFANASG